MFVGKINRRNNDIYDVIAANIKVKRKEANLTQAELADLTEYSHEFIRRIEAPNTKKYFSVETLVQIAKALDIKMEDLFVGIDNINLGEKMRAAEKRKFE